MLSPLEGTVQFTFLSETSFDLFFPRRTLFLWFSGWGKKNAWFSPFTWRAHCLNDRGRTTTERWWLYQTAQSRGSWRARRCEACRPRNANGTTSTWSASTRSLVKNDYFETYILLSFLSRFKSLRKKVAFLGFSCVKFKRSFRSTRSCSRYWRTWYVCYAARLWYAAYDWDAAKTSRAVLSSLIIHLLHL